LLNANGSNFGSCFVVLEPFAKRRGKPEQYDEAIAQKLRKLFAEEIQDAIVTVFRAPPIQGLGSAGGFKMQLQQRGFVELKGLQQTTDDLVAEGRKDPRLVGLFSLYRAGTPQLYVDINRVKCETLDLSLDEVFQTLQVYMGGAYVNLFNKFGRTWQVNLQADEQFRTDAKALGQLKVRNRAGGMVPLSSVAEVRDVAGPVMVMRYNSYLSAPVNGNSARGTSSGQAITIMEDLAKQQNVAFEWTELTYLQLREGSGAIVAFALGTALIFLVLAAQYESWSMPMAIILVVPMCLLCAI